jgi:hypothetical protein
VNINTLEKTSIETESERQLAALFIITKDLYKSNKNLFPIDYGLVYSQENDKISTQLVLDAREDNKGKYLWQLNIAKITGYGEDHEDYIADWPDARQVWQLDLQPQDFAARKITINRQGSITKSEDLDLDDTLLLVQDIEGLIQSEEFITEKDKRHTQKKDALGKLNAFTKKYPNIDKAEMAYTHLSDTKITEYKKLNQAAKTIGFLAISPLKVD